MQLETDKKILGAKIRKYRKMHNLTQFQLAEKIDLNEKQVYRIEYGQNYPTYLTLVKLLEVLEMDISVLLKDSEPRRTSLPQEIENILLCANDFELTTYTDVLKALKKNLKNK